MEIMAILGLIGAGISAWGSYSEGQESQKAQEYNAQIAEREARLARAGAAKEVSVIKQNAALNEYYQRKQLATVTGEQVGGYAARGVSVSTGSPLDVMAETISDAELSIAINKWSAESEAAMVTYNAEVAAKRGESEARMRRLYGESAAKSGAIRGVGTLLSAGATAYDRFGKEIPKKTTIG